MKIIEAISIEAIEIHNILSDYQLARLHEKIIEYVNARIFNNKNKDIKFTMINYVWVPLVPNYLSFNLCVKNDFPHFDYFIVDEVKFYNSVADFMLAKHLQHVTNAGGYTLN